MNKTKVSPVNQLSYKQLVVGALEEVLVVRSTRMVVALSPGHPATTMAHHQWPQVMVWHTEAPAAIQAHKLRHLVPTCGGEMDVGAHWW